MPDIKIIANEEVETLSHISAKCIYCGVENSAIVHFGAHLTNICVCPHFCRIEDPTVKETNWVFVFNEQAKFYEGDGYS